jgi:PAS domain S-box-containing protein
VQTGKAIPREQAGPRQGPLHAAGEDVYDGGNISAAAVRVTGILGASAALVTLATGVVVLFGWLLDVPSLKSVLPGFVTMKANTAVGFILAGVSLALLGRAARSARIRRLSQACAGGTALLGLLTLSQYLFGWNLGIDQLLFRAPAGAVGALFPGRMAPATAIDFLLLGGALFLAGFRRTILASQWLALLAGVIGWLALLGYLYGAPNRYGIGHYAQMAVHTAAVFIILGQGVLLAHPADGLMRMVTSDTMGRWLLRRLAPLAVAVPLVLGWLRVQGEKHGYFEGKFGVALMMLVLMVILMTMILWTSRALTRIDTVRRQAEARLGESEQRHRSIFECSRDALMTLAPPSWKFISANPAALERFGVKDVAGFTALGPWDLSPEIQPDGRPSAEKAKEMIETALREGSHLFEWTHKLLSGEDFPASVLLNRMELAGQVVLHATVRDITERVRVEEALRTKTALLEAQSETSIDGILAVADQGKSILFNTRFGVMWNIPREVLDTGDDDLMLQHVLGQLSDPDEFLAKMRHLYAHRDERSRDEVSLKDGRTLDRYSSPLIDAGGRYFGRIWFFRDITERKGMEHELRRLAVFAEAANRAKSQFLANMSHEIRTPMTAILGFAEMLTNSIECCTTCHEHQTCPTRVQNKENIKVIQRNGEHLLGLINDVLDLSKVEAGKMEVERVACSPVQIVEETVSLMRVRAIEKGLTLDARYEFPLPEAILSDPARVRQILVNLTGNAVKFTLCGGVEIVLRCVTDIQAGRAVLAFDVKDSGIGMTPEQIDRLFQPFAQADSSTTRQFGGTGLGLAISKKLAEALGGDIQVKSTPGQGSTFTFTMKAGLPAPVRMLNELSEMAPHASHQPQSACPAGIKLRGAILLAEDGPDNQLLISTILRKAGAEVDLAVNGLVAVEMALAARLAGVGYDVILMDMQMPEMDGYEATRKLRLAGYTGAIIALTAHAMAEDRARCIDAGCDDYAAKPVDRLGLLTTLAGLMGSPARQGDAVASPELGPEESPAVAEPAPAAPQQAQADGGPIMSQYADDPEMSELIEAFVARLPETADAMAEALANNCFDELRWLAHQLKGSGGGYGYPSLTEHARKLEDSARAADGEAARLALDELKATVRAAVAGRDAAAAMKGEKQ